MSHHLNLDAIRRNLLTNGLIDKDTAVVVLVQDRKPAKIFDTAAPIPGPCCAEHAAQDSSDRQQDLVNLRNELSATKAALASYVAEVQTLKAQNQRLASNQATVAVTTQANAWKAVAIEIQKTTPDLFGPGGTTGREDVLNWIRQSARLRETFNQGLAETTAQ